MNTRVIRIGAAKDADEIAEEFMSDLELGKVEEALLITSYRDENTGEIHWHYRRTRLRSKFTLMGVTHWIANELVNEATP